MRKIFYLAMLLAFFTSCKFLTPNIMLQTRKDFKYTEFKDTSAAAKDYRISANDIIEFRLYANDGFKLVDLTSLNSGGSTPYPDDRTYPVEFDGTVKLPVIGRTKLEGLTIRQAEMMLEEKYAEFYVKPFVLLEVRNKRIIIFPGNAGAARVLTLSNSNTTLIEALALSGGITSDGKAWKIKVIRGYSTPKPEVYLVDLSRIEGIDKAGMILQANDIVYVEPRKRIARETLQEITPIISLLSAFLFAYSLVRGASN
jgi:polysaccharide export outer membrane protein